MAALHPRRLNQTYIAANSNLVNPPVRSELASVLSAPQPQKRQQQSAPNVTREEVPTVPITEDELNQLMNTVKNYHPPVEFIPEVEALLRDYIRKTWRQRKEQKSFDQLMIEIQHPCSEEFLKKKIEGVPGTTTLSFNDIII